MSRVCGLFLFGIGIGLFLALIFPKSLFMVIMAIEENKKTDLVAWTRSVDVSISN